MVNLRVHFINYSIVLFVSLKFYSRKIKCCLCLECAEFEEFDVKPTIFTYNELRVATRDFHPDMKLGQGSYGAVYKVELLTLYMNHVIRILNCIAYEFISSN